MVVNVSDESELNFIVHATQGRNAEIASIKVRLEKENLVGFKLLDGIVFREDDKGDLLLYVPSKLEENVIRLAHEKICHMGIEKHTNE